MALFKCRRCGVEQTVRWEAECPNCGGFYRPVPVRADAQSKLIVTAASALTDMADVERIPTGIANIDEILNGGLVEGQSVQVGGPAGSGKSRLCLQILQSLVERQERPVVFASAEETMKDVVVMCKQVGATSDRIRVLGTDGDAFDIYDVLAICDELKPVVLGLDSLQAADGWTTQNHDTAKIIKDYCDKTGMCALVMNHMTGSLELKGGTNTTHMFKAVIYAHEYDPKQDGKIKPTFGARFARSVEEGEAKLTDIRVFFSGKNRSGGSARKCFFIFDEHGKLQPLPTKTAKKYPVGVDESEEEEEDAI